MRGAQRLLGKITSLRANAQFEKSLSAVLISLSPKRIYDYLISKDARTIMSGPIPCWGHPKKKSLSRGSKKRWLDFPSQVPMASIGWVWGRWGAVADHFVGRTVAWRWGVRSLCSVGECQRNFTRRRWTGRWTVPDVAKGFNDGCSHFGILIFGLVRYVSLVSEARWLVSWTIHSMDWILPLLSCGPINRASCPPLWAMGWINFLTEMNGSSGCSCFQVVSVIPWTWVKWPNNPRRLEKNKPHCWHWILFWRPMLTLLYLAL